MTAQIGDIYRYQSKEYDMVALSAPIPFHPKNYGLIPHESCTACHRGYWCTYTILDGHLVLNDLYLFNKDGNYPLLNGRDISPQKFKEFLGCKKGGTELEPVLLPAYYGHRVYEEVNLLIDYTGRILVGRTHTPTNHIEGIWNDPWRYKELLEFVFDGGVLTDIIDQSETARDIRKMIRTLARSKPESHGTMGTFVRLDLGVLDLIGANLWWIDKQRSKP